MKMRNIFFNFFICLFSFNSFSQAQWKFHVAFEDATGSKDTLWMIYDSTAHDMLPTDTLLGEGKFQFDYSKFNVWILNYDNDSTKTFALPYTNFPYHALYGIEAFNYQYPILISWDTALFNSPILPSEPDNYINYAAMGNYYFFLINNDPSLLHTYNMLIDNSALAPAFSFGSQSHFPLEIRFYYFPVGINEPSNEVSPVKVFPIPFDMEIKLASKLPIDEIEIQSLDGKSILKLSFDKSFFSGNYKIYTENISNGIYILSMRLSEGKTLRKMIVK